MTRKDAWNPEVRISYLWLQSFETDLDAAIGTYRRLAHKLLIERRSDDSWCLPWEDPESLGRLHEDKHPGLERRPISPADISLIEPFWISLLGKKRQEPVEKESIGAAEALGCLLPLRLIQSEHLQIPAEGIRVNSWVERFFLPLSVATVLTIRVRRKNLLDMYSAIRQLVDFACGIHPRIEDRRSMLCREFAGVQLIELPKFPVEYLERLAGEPLGRLSSPGRPALLTTVISSPWPAEEQRELMARALLGFCTQNPLWYRNGNASQLELDVQLGDNRLKPNGRCYYGGNVATWSCQAYAEVQGRKARALSRYHRHQIFAGLQVRAAVGALAKLGLLQSRGLGKNVGRPWGTALWGSLRGIDPDEFIFRLKHRPWLMSVAGLMGRIYGGNDSAYKTWTSHGYIKRTETADLINSIRERFVKPPLFSQLDQENTEKVSDVKPASALEITTSDSQTGVNPG